MDKWYVVPAPYALGQAAVRTGQSRDEPFVISFCAVEQEDNALAWTKSLGATQQPSEQR